VPASVTSAEMVVVFDRPGVFNGSARYLEPG
jgi:hypothetical protein